MSIDFDSLSPEVKAMAVVDGALKNLEPTERERVLRWAFSCFCPDAVPDSGGSKKSGKVPKEPQDDEKEVVESKEHETLAELMAAATPKTDVERTLLVGYWLQEEEKHAQLASAAINRELKHLGHGVKNITSALSSLIKEKPQLVVQLRKSGSSQQARKQYKITEAGKTAVKKMLAGTGE
jgi:hypothetical protein